MMERQAKDGTIYQQVGEDQWTPVTRQAKDGTVYKKVGADSWTPIEERKPSVVESGVRNLVQAASAGFSDELAGGISGLGRALGVEGLGGPMKNIRLAKGGPTTDLNAIKDAYYGERDNERAAIEKDFEVNPMASTASSVVGAVASPINKIGKGLSIAKQGALLGGIGGAGVSEADSALGVVGDAIEGAALGGLIGKGAQKGQELVSTGASKLARYISPAKQKMNTAEIRAAAKELGINVTPGMLDDSGFIERLESALAKSPSYLGQRVARNQRAVTDRLTDTVSDLTKDATSLSPYQMGEKVKSGIAAKVGERLDPISAIFDEVADSTKSIPVGDNSKSAIIRNIQNLDTFKLTGGAGKPQQYVDMISRVENADQVKTMMTLLNQDIAASMGAERQVLIGIKDKLSRLESNSIMRAAIKTAKEGGMRESTGKQIGTQIVSDLKDARQEYRKLADDLGGVAEGARIKTSKGPSAFLDSVENIPSERIQDKFFNVENNRQLLSLRDKFPEQFDLLRQGKLREIADSAVDSSLNGRGNISAQRFLKEVNKLNPEAKQMIFGEGLRTIDNVQTIQQSLPRNYNPSGTASEVGWQDAIYKNVKDIPTYLLYKGASSNLANDISQRMVNAKVPQISEAVRKAPQLTNPATSTLTNVPNGNLSQLSRAAESEPPKKGPEKWVTDGIEKLNQAGIPSETLEQLRSTPKGRELLIEASDATPNSKRMESVLQRIRSASSNKGGE